VGVNRGLFSDELTIQYCFCHISMLKLKKTKATGGICYAEGYCLFHDGPDVPVPAVERAEDGIR
jgi:hypothetical protein